MDSMQEFWACQWLLTNIGETYKTQEILKAIEIAQSEGRGEQTTFLGEFIYDAPLGRINAADGWGFILRQ